MKLKIDNDLLAEEFFSDVVMMGIVATTKDYQFIWQLNQLTGLDFRLSSTYEVQLSRKQRDYFFSIYEYHIPVMGVAHYLYHNHHDGEFLLPEFKHLDFLWIMKGDCVDANYLPMLTESIRSLPGVQLVSELSPEKIKHKQYLIL